MAEPSRLLTPDAVARLGRLPLLARQVVEGFLTGLHASPYHGFSVEFAEHRKYAPGDPLRDLDWTAYARTDRYYVKRYREETNLRCRLLVDASGSMDFASEGCLRKIDYACALAACLAYLAHRQRDAVGLTLCAGDRTVDLPPGAKGADLRRVLDTLESVRAGGTPPLADTFHQTAERMRRRGLVIVLSDLLDSEAALVKALKHLRHRRHEILLFHLLDPAEEDLPYRQITEFVDLETGTRLRADPQAFRREYRDAVAAFRTRYRRLCADSGIDYVDVNTRIPFERLLAQYLVRRAKA